MPQLSGNEPILGLNTRFPEPRNTERMSAKAFQYFSNREFERQGSETLASRFPESRNPERTNAKTFGYFDN
jgi:hypothetical protein